MTTPDTYKEPTVYHFPNAIVTVHRPELTPEERDRRMKAIYRHASNLLKEVVK